MVSAPVMATPATAPVSESVMFVPIAAMDEMRLPTAPVGTSASSRMGVRVTTVSARTGAVLRRIVP